MSTSPTSSATGVSMSDHTQWGAPIGQQVGQATATAPSAAAAPAGAEPQDRADVATVEDTRTLSLAVFDELVGHGYTPSYTLEYVQARAAALAGPAPAEDTSLVRQGSADGSASATAEVDMLLAEGTEDEHETRRAQVQTPPMDLELDPAAAPAQEYQTRRAQVQTPPMDLELEDAAEPAMPGPGPVVDEDEAGTIVNQLVNAEGMIDRGIGHAEGLALAMQATASQYLLTRVQALRVLTNLVQRGYEPACVVALNAAIQAMASRIEDEQCQALGCLEALVRIGYAPAYTEARTAANHIVERGRQGETIAAAKSLLAALPPAGEGE